MALSGWHWTIFGLIVSGFSGYVYFAVPTSNGPNMSMALFFFIGILFLIIGVIKLFFKKVDDNAVFNSVRKSENSNEVKILNTTSSNDANASKPLSVQMDIVKPKEQNKVDEEITKLAAAHEKKHQTHTHQGTHTLQTGHSNSYSRTHQYHGPAKTVASTAPNAAHPVNAHIQQRIVNTSDHSIKCRQCGQSNVGSANYCHGCGNRLK